VHALLPLLGACVAAYLVSGLMMKHTIMTEKIARRGVRVPDDYAADYLDRVLVRDACSRSVVSLRASDSLAKVHQWIDGGSPATKHQGFPVIDHDDRLLGVVTRRDLFDRHSAETLVGSLMRRAPLVVVEDHSLREAADHMVEAEVGRLVVVDRFDTRRMVGIITRSDLLAVHARRLHEARKIHRHFSSKLPAHR
jgi:CBS domain-containing protein